MKTNDSIEDKANMKIKTQKVLHMLLGLSFIETLASYYILFIKTNFGFELMKADSEPFYEKIFNMLGKDSIETIGIALILCVVSTLLSAFLMYFQNRNKF